MRFAAVMLAVVALLAGCERTETPQASPPAKPATPSTQSTTKLSPQRLESAAAARRVGQAIMVYSAAHPTTQSTQPATQP